MAAEGREGGSRVITGREGGRRRGEAISESEGYLYRCSDLVFVKERIRRLCFSSSFDVLFAALQCRASTPAFTWAGQRASRGRACRLDARGA